MGWTAADAQLTDPAKAPVPKKLDDVRTQGTAVVGKACLDTLASCRQSVQTAESGTVITVDGVCIVDRLAQCRGVMAATPAEVDGVRRDFAVLQDAAINGTPAPDAAYMSPPAASPPGRTEQQTSIRCEMDPKNVAPKLRVCQILVMHGADRTVLQIPVGATESFRLDADNDTYCMRTQPNVAIDAAKCTPVKFTVKDNSGPTLTPIAIVTLRK
jgi:hypothetical protein